VKGARWLGVVVPLGVAGLATLALLELGVRWLTPQPLGFSWLDPNGLEIHVPHLDATYRRSEFAARVRINGLGLRGPEIEEPKPAGRIRVLALGDSFVEGMQVGEADLMTTRAERALAAAGRPVEIVNGGVSGYGTDDALDLLRAYGPRLAPDLVVLFFCIANDYQNNLVEGRCRLEGGHLRCDAPPRPTRRQLRFAHAKSWLASHFELYQALKTSATSPFFERIGLRAPLAPAAPASMPFGADVFREPPPAYVADAFRLSAALLAALRDEARALGAPLWLVPVPIREQVEDAQWTEFGESLPPTARDAPQRALAASAAALGVPVLDPLPAFRARDASGEHLYWRIDAHFNATGHEVMASLLTPALRDFAERRP